MPYKPVMTIDELNAFFAREVHSEIKNPDRHQHVIEELGDGFLRTRLIYHERNLRHGGTLSGPTLMSSTDHASYACIVAHFGPAANAVTTNLNINLLRRPAARDLFAEAHLLKLGKRLANCEVYLRVEGDDELVGHAVTTFSMPPSS